MGSTSTATTLGPRKPTSEADRGERNFIRYALAWSLALVLLYRGGNAIRHSIEARTWPVTTGIIQASDARWIAGHYHLARPLWSYRLQLRYTYQVAGKEYIGTRASFGGWGDDELNNPFAAAIARALPAGAVVPVHYDPGIALFAGIGLILVGHWYWERAKVASLATRRDYRD